MSSKMNYLPPQCKPIDRTPSGAMAFAAGSGVEASGFWDVLGDVAKAAAPVALPALAGLI